MKSLGMLRISIIALGIAAMSIAPRCSAQSEIDPDHFDGTDSWQTVAVAKLHAPKTNPAKTAAGQVLNGNTSGHATLRATGVRNLPNAQGAGGGCVSGQAKRFRSEGQASMILYNAIVDLAAGVALVSGC